MEVRPGYKQTEAGVIPEDWEVRLLRDVVEFTNGKPHESNVEAGGRYCLITLDSIGIDGRLKAEHKRTDVFDSSLQKGDIVAVLSDLAHGNLLGLCDLIPADGTYVLNQRMARLRLTVPAAERFVRLQINRRQEHFRKRGQGTSQKHVYRRDFDALPIPFPEPAEQEAIAEALGDADALIESLEQLLVKKRQLKQGAMQELLTGKKRLPGFESNPGHKRGEVGVIPKDWEAVPLGSLGAFAKGQGIRKDETASGDIPCVRYGEIYTHHNDIIRAFNSRISADVAKSSKRLMKGDLLFAGSGETKEEIGKCVAFIGREEVYAGGDIVILSPSKGNSTFFGYLFNAPIAARQKASKAQGDAVVHISANALSSIKVPLPPTKAEQKAIATILSDMDAGIAALEARLTKTRSIKQGMMQELLTGRIRLV